MRARVGLIGVASLIFVSACPKTQCNPQTVLLQYTLVGQATAADAIDVTLAIAHGMPRTMTVQRKRSAMAGSIEVDFASYPSGQLLAFTLTAHAGERVLAVASETTTALPQCTVLSFSLGGATNDLSAGAGSNDMSTPDLTTSGPDLSPTCPTTCRFGCAATPTVHCKELQPSSVVTANDYGGPLAMQTIASDVVINTDSGAISGGITRAAGPGVMNGIGFRVATQTNGPSVGIFGVGGLLLNAGHKITFSGSNAFALASSADVRIDGAILAGCSAGGVGPGGSSGGNVGVAGGSGVGLGGGAGGASGVAGASGGGGGAFGDIGGTGASGMSTTTTVAGALWSNVAPSGTVLLVGGSGGGAGGGNSGGAGGGGGGAVQLSVNGTLTVSGTIDVGGCGGAHVTAGAGGGGGGGAGGAIVLEAATLMLTATAVLSSNGGGGGGGGDTTASDGNDGAPGSRAAMGGAAGVGGGGGGSGGARGALAGVHNTEGGNALASAGAKYGAGGGGGTGRILLRDLTLDSAAAMVISPDFGDINANNMKMTTTMPASFQ